MTMFTQELTTLIEKELDARTESMQKELNEYKKTVYDLQVTNTQLKEKLSKVEEAETNVEFINFLKTMIDENTIDSFIDQFPFTPTSIRIKGMDVDKMPKWFKLFVTYYDDRKKLLQLLELLEIDFPIWAKSLRFPQDYTKEEVLHFIEKDLHNRYITNGCIFDDNIGFYWRAIAANKGEPLTIMNGNNSFTSSIPWQLFLQNPHLKDPEVYHAIIKQIKRQKENNSLYFYEIQEYQAIPEEFIELLFEALPLEKNKRIYENFIRRNHSLIKKNPSIAILFEKEMNREERNAFYFLNYPIDMQIHYIQSLNVSLEIRIGLIKKMSISPEEKIALLHEAIDKESLE